MLTSSNEEKNDNSTENIPVEKIDAVGGDEEIVILVLKDQRIKAKKEKLRAYSLYFASLFSENFRDHDQIEFTINYEIPFSTLQDFVNWAHQENDHTRVMHSTKFHCVVRKSLEKFLDGGYPELLDLLNLSVIFMVERLTENITHMLICMKLKPDDMLALWILSENLGLEVLKQVAHASLMERFNEIPLDSVAALTIEQFCKLALNVHNMGGVDSILCLREEWKMGNCCPTNLADPYKKFLEATRSELESSLDSRKRPRNMQCLVALNPSKRTLVIAASDGNDLKVIAEMTGIDLYTTFNDNGKVLEGFRVFGRGFYIYLVGGESGIGSGRFNLALWRYCMFTKKWYIEHLLPRNRRHMGIAVIGNKLYLFGGVGQHRMKLDTLDIYNFHTSEWSTGAEIPESFANIPASCVVNNKIIYFKSEYYIYDPATDIWTTYCPGPEILPGQSYDCVRTLIGYTRPHNTSILYISYYDPDTMGISLQRCSFGAPGTEVTLKTVHEWEPCKGISDFRQQILDGSYLVTMSVIVESVDGSIDDVRLQVEVEVGELKEPEAATKNDEPANERLKQTVQETYRRLKTFRKDLNRRIRLASHPFNVAKPDSLFTMISLSEEESIRV